MIIVEIFVPSVDGTYEFKLNEDIEVSLIIDEICSVICEKEQCPMPTNCQDMVLFNADREVRLNENLTLFENDICSGNRLILV